MRLFKAENDQNVNKNIIIFKHTLPEVVICLYPLQLILTDLKMRLIL